MTSISCDGVVELGCEGILGFVVGFIIFISWFSYFRWKQNLRHVHGLPPRWPITTTTIAFIEGFLFLLLVIPKTSSLISEGIAHFLKFLFIALLPIFILAFSLDIVNLIKYRSGTGKVTLEEIEKSVTSRAKALDLVDPDAKLIGLRWDRDNNTLWLRFRWEEHRPASSDQGQGKQLGGSEREQSATSSDKPQAGQSGDGEEGQSTAVPAQQRDKQPCECEGKQHKGQSVVYEAEIQADIWGNILFSRVKREDGMFMIQQ